LATRAFEFAQQESSDGPRRHDRYPTKRADQCCVEVGKVQLERLLAGLSFNEGQQQPERVPVGGDGSDSRPFG
jgi:hypothetical protein